MSSSVNFICEIDVRSVMYAKLTKYNEKIVYCESKKSMLTHLISELSNDNKLEKKYFKYLTDSCKKISKYILQIETTKEKIETLRELIHDLEIIKMRKYYESLNKVIREKESETPYYEEEEEEEIKKNNDDDNEYYDEFK